MGPIQRCPPTGPDHPHTLSTIARLADNLGKQQSWTEADELSRTADEHATTALGAEHETALSCRLTPSWTTMSRSAADLDSVQRLPGELVAEARCG
ncbi:hypothetical protein ACW4TU_44825 [Streptomyces sp. QTS52]